MSVVGGFVTFSAFGLDFFSFEQWQAGIKPGKELVVVFHNIGTAGDAEHGHYGHDRYDALRHQLVLSSEHNKYEREFTDLSLGNRGFKTGALSVTGRRHAEHGN